MGKGLPLDVRLFLLGVAAIVLSGGGLLFFAPDVILPRWPWRLAPFNARFLGAIYLTEFSIIAFVLWRNRWPPAWFVLALSFTFTAIISSVTVLHAGEFSYTRKSVQLWHLLYLAPVVLAAWWLWKYRASRRGPAMALPRWANRLLGAEAVILIVYAALLLLAPRWASAFWPWPVDPLHGRMFASVFAALGQGAWHLYRHAASTELVVQGIGQTAFGVLAIAGLVIVDRQLHWVAWNSPAPWLWVAAAVAIAVAGLVLLGLGLRVHRTAPSHA